jgi:uncharacterized protein (DUF433 family)
MLVGDEKSDSSFAPVLAGTRVPVQTLIEYLEGGDKIDDFVRYPALTA